MAPTTGTGDAFMHEVGVPIDGSGREIGQGGLSQNARPDMPLDLLRRGTT
jgi:hypothetical protein